MHVQARAGPKCGFQGDLINPIPCVQVLGHMEARGLHVAVAKLAQVAGPLEESIQQVGKQACPTCKDAFPLK